MTETNGKPLTAEQIVEGLRGDDDAAFTAAFNALYPDPREGAVLIRCDALTDKVTSTSRLNPTRIFSRTLVVAQQTGNAIGHRLDWVRAAPESELQLPPGLRR